MWQGFRKPPNEPTVMLMEYRHGCGSTAPATVRVHHERNILSPWMLIRKSLGTEAPIFFTFREEDDDIVSQGCAAAERAQGFEQGYDSGAVIDSAWPSRDRVIMAISSNAPVLFAPEDRAMMFSGTPAP